MPITFDISYAWHPSGEWTSLHQMSVNGRRDGFKREDLLALADVAEMLRTDKTPFRCNGGRKRMNLANPRIRVFSVYKPQIYR